MQAQLLILPIFVPVVFWAAYHYHKDRHLPEPMGNLLLCFLLGAGATYLSHALYVSLDFVGLRFDASILADTSKLGLLAYSLIAIGPIEEFAKFLPFAVIVLRFRSLDEPIDGIIYASFIGLGYAAMENVQYLAFLTPTEAIARGFAGPVVHIAFASIWAHWVAAAHLNGQSVTGAAFAGVALAAAAHGFYDFAVFLDPRYSLPIAAFIVVAIWLWRLRLLRTLDRAARVRQRRDSDNAR